MNAVPAVRALVGCSAPTCRARCWMLLSCLGFSVMVDAS